jgi:hypothetical protein
MISQLCNPGLQGDLLHLARQVLPPILAELGLEPTNSEELKNLILELQCSRTQIAFMMHKKIRKGETPALPQVPRLEAFWLINPLLLHLETTANPEEVEGVMRTLLDKIPGTEHLRILISKPEESLKLAVLNETELRKMGLQRIPENMNNAIVEVQRDAEG